MLPRFVKPIVFLLALVPFGRLIVLGFSGGLGANPVEFVTRATGWWALAFLCLTLAVTPLRRLTGWPALVRLRRMLGLYAMFYASLHFVTYVWLDQWFSPAGIVTDIVKRPFITVGFLAFVLLLPLALTSTQAMVRRLGRNWRRLHRLVYPIAILAVLHFWWMKAGKNALAEPMQFALLVAALLGVRVLWAVRAARAGRSR